jgi:hypothetical protein
MRYTWIHQSHQLIHRTGCVARTDPPEYMWGLGIFVDYETTKQERKVKPISEYRYDERLKTKDEESTCLSDTGRGRLARTILTDNL